MLSRGDDPIPQVTGHVPAAMVWEATGHLHCMALLVFCPACCPSCLGAFQPRCSPGRLAPDYVAARAHPSRGRIPPSALLNFMRFLWVHSSSLSGCPSVPDSHSSVSTGTSNSVSSENYRTVQAVTFSRSWPGLSSAPCEGPLVTGLLTTTFCTPQSNLFFYLSGCPPIQTITYQHGRKNAVGDSTEDLGITEAMTSAAVPLITYLGIF